MNNFVKVKKKFKVNKKKLVKIYIKNLNSKDMNNSANKTCENLKF